MTFVLLEATDICSASRGVSGSVSVKFTERTSFSWMNRSRMGEITGGWFVSLGTWTSQLRVFQSLPSGSVRTNWVESLTETRTRRVPSPRVEKDAGKLFEVKAVLVTPSMVQTYSRLDWTGFTVSTW